MANELKPCPFCASSAKVKRVGSAFTIYCENLHRINSFESKEEAARQWNTRPAAPVEGLERYDISMFGNGAVEMGGGEYVRFDQAEAIIAAQAEHIATLESSLEAMEKRAQEAEADNAALTARVKELKQVVIHESDCVEAAKSHIEAIEAQLAAARKALTDIQCMDWGCLAVSDVFDEINEIVERAALEAKP